MPSDHSRALDHQRRSPNGAPTAIFHDSYFSMKRPLIALLTDFGTDSPYVGQLKAAIWAESPDANLVDVTHNIAPQAIRHAALLLREAHATFPSSTIFVVVVDPSVGSDRPILGIATPQATLIGPDNGALSAVFTTESLASAFRLEAEKFAPRSISATFHGRDIMAPAAARIANGIGLDRLGIAMPMDQAVQLDFPKPAIRGAIRGSQELSQIVGRIEYADSFGNLITNVHQDDLGNRLDWSVEVGGTEIPLVRYYSEQPEGQLVALVGSQNWLEIALVNGNARQCLQLSEHEKLICSRQTG